MAEQEAKDEAAKRRIITHMNEDHHDSVCLYVSLLDNARRLTALLDHTILGALPWTILLDGLQQHHNQC